MIATEDQAIVACPTCGCRHAPVIAWREHWGQRVAIHACRHCGRRFVGPDSSKPEPAPGAARPAVTGVTYPTLRCPACQSRAVKTTSTRRPTRYHRCEDCGHTFKSVEEL